MNHPQIKYTDLTWELTEWVPAHGLLAGLVARQWAFNPEMLSVAI